MTRRKKRLGDHEYRPPEVRYYGDIRTLTRDASGKQRCDVPFGRNGSTPFDNPQCVTS